jgi:hypothetical protein
MDRQITVCASCLQASCWQGIFMCDEAECSDIIELPISKLIELDLENPRFWEE